MTYMYIPYHPFSLQHFSSFSKRQHISYHHSKRLNRITQGMNVRGLFDHRGRGGGTMAVFAGFPSMGMSMPRSGENTHDKEINHNTTASDTKHEETIDMFDLRFGDDHLNALYALVD